jgi:NADPH:quinone reductase-like Zn-dependent oxidoreductase
MEAVILPTFGAPNVLRLEDVATPEPAADEVLVRVAACGLNNLDVQLRAGRFLPNLSLPHILGAEPAGEIAGLGNGVDGWEVGDRVVVPPWVGCGRCEFCLAGEPTTCTRLQFIGVSRPGAYAQYIAVPARQLVAVPDTVSLEDAAAVTLSALTAWHMLTSRTQVKAEDQILVLAAGSGVGSAAVQIAKFFGCRVIASAGSDEKLERALELGADAVIHHYREDLEAAVAHLTGGRGVDVVFEHVGEATWEQSLNCLAHNGRVVTCGATTGAAGRVDLRQLFIKQIAVLGSRGGTPAELRRLLDLVAQGQIRPVIDRRYPLAEAVDAHRRLETQRQFGKILLLP